MGNGNLQNFRSSLQNKRRVLYTANREWRLHIWKCTGTNLTQVCAVEVLELAALPHVAVGALAVADDRVCDLDCEARGAVEAVPSQEREID